MLSVMRYRINKPKVIQEVFDDEVVIVNLDAGTYYSLNPSGGEVWRFFEKGAAPQEIVEALASRFTDDPSRIQNEIDRLIDELVRENLIVMRPTPADAPISSDEIIGPPAVKKSFESPTIAKYTDMKDILLLDPIHEVDDAGWPNKPAPPDENK
jgi:hypothetical protein